MHPTSNPPASFVDSSASRTTLQYASHATQAASFLIPLLVLVIVSISWLVRAYGAIMASYLARLPRVLLDLAQAAICVACLRNFVVYANHTRRLLRHPKMDFLNSFSTVFDLLMLATSFFVWTVVGIYAIEIFASGQRPKPLSKVWELEPFAGLRSLLSRQTPVTAAALTSSTRNPTASNKADETDDTNVKDDDTDETPESGPDESPLSGDTSALSALEHTELLGWQSVAKAR
ncbi:hypothetical protein LTR85_005996 [Meristemomyces frigidus]|nr:hypothetical protein LTR85_005996 [Meristemomyces frigidus]